MRAPTAMKLALAPIIAIASSECGPSDRPFPVRAPLWQDSDLRSVVVPCRFAPTAKEPRHVSCAPQAYDSPLIWDGLDNLLFRPISETFGVETSAEAVNVNSLDEVPDSAWFTNRLGVHAMSLQQLRLGACSPLLLLDDDDVADGAWVIDKGKGAGSNAGFRINIPGKGKYLFKADDLDGRQSAAQTVGLAVYHAIGYNTPCEQIVYFKPSWLKLTPGLHSHANFQDDVSFDRAALDKILAGSPRRGDRVRMQASAWIPGYVIGAFRYEGTRADDPNDVIAHEDRRDIRAQRLVNAWLDRVDAREGNTLDSWMSDRKDQPDSSPGRVVHYYMDTSECFGPGWGWEEITRRMGYSYVVDWGDLALDFLTLGAPTRTWDRVRVAPGHETFAYFNVQDFVPDQWKMEYPNAAFSRMTERDGAWMARILSRFSPELVRALAAMGQLTEATNAAYLAITLEGRLERILDRYLTRRSPIADLTIEGSDRLCGVDLAERRGVRPPDSFRYVARWSKGGALAVERRERGGICVTLPHVGDDSAPAFSTSLRYVTVTLHDGVATGPLVAHLYDFGPTAGYWLAGIERPEP